MFGARGIEIRDRQDSRTLPAFAEGLAGSMPRLTTDARRAAATINAGVHGRRRSGQGETFWQFRPFTSGEAAHRIDWRRSARDDRLYVREREWEAAQAVHIFIDRSVSMDYRSAQALDTKCERAIILGLAAADMLVRGGERVALMGATRPMASRRVIERLGEALLLDNGYGMALPSLSLPAASEAIVITDAIAPLAEIERSLHTLAERGARGALVLISDPAEETFPYTGQTEFLDRETGQRMRFGDAGELAGAYALKIAAHREGVKRIVHGAGWTLIPHRTDQAASMPLLQLSAALSAGSSR